MNKYTVARTQRVSQFLSSVFETYLNASLPLLSDLLPSLFLISRELITHMYVIYTSNKLKLIYAYDLLFRALLLSFAFLSFWHMQMSRVSGSLWCLRLVDFYRLCTPRLVSIAIISFSSKFFFIRYFYFVFFSFFSQLKFHQFHLKLNNNLIANYLGFSLFFFVISIKFSGRFDFEHLFVFFIFFVYFHFTKLMSHILFFVLNFWVDCFSLACHRQRWFLFYFLSEFAFNTKPVRRTVNLNLVVKIRLVFDGFLLSIKSFLGNNSNLNRECLKHLTHRSAWLSHRSSVTWITAYAHWSLN